MRALTSVRSEADLNAGQPAGRVRRARSSAVMKAMTEPGWFAEAGRAIGRISDDECAMTMPARHLGDRRHAFGDAGRSGLARRSRHVDQRAELPRQLLFHGEGLDHGNALHGFLHRPDEVRVDLHGFAGPPA